jgi:hypothetical protein
MRQDLRVSTAWLVIVVSGVGGGLVAAFVIPPISKRRNLRRARDSGARWVGLAQIDADDVHPVAAVQRAMSGVGSYYGSFFAPRGLPRRVGGLMFVEADRLRWEPRLWFGRGRAQGWEIPLAIVSGVKVTPMPPPAVRAFWALLCTTEGNERFLVVDPEGLKAVLPPAPN